MLPLNVLTIGAGMYAIGKNTAGYGTILPTLAQEQAESRVGDIIIAGKSKATRPTVRSKTNELDELTGLDTQVSVFPKSGDDDTAYLSALDRLEMPGAVIIATPDHLHATMAKQVLNRGFPVLVVKPLAPTIDEAVELAELSAQENVYGAVELHKRFDPANKILKRDLANGDIGNPVQIHVEYSQNISIPTEVFSEWVTNTNIFQYLGPHYVDVIQWVTGANPERVVASGQKNRLRSMGVNTYDAIQTLIEWSTPEDTHFTSSMLTSWIDPTTSAAMSDQLIKVWGTKGRIFLDQKDRGIEKVTKRDGVETINPLFSQWLPDADSGKLRLHGYGPESIRTFIKDSRQINAGTIQPPELEGRRPTFRDALSSTAVVEAVNRSLNADGEWTAVESLS